MFDLNTLALKETTTLQLRHPVTDEPLFADKEQTKPVTIELYGTSSKQYRNAVTAMQNRALRRNAKKDKPSAEVLRAEAVQLLVACSAGSTNFKLDGKEVKTEADFDKLYSDPSYSWVKDQVDEGLGETANFLAQ